MKTLNSYFFLTLFLSFPILSLAQKDTIPTTELSDDDLVFLWKARDQYQDWLEGSELGKIVKVSELFIANKEDLVVLDLEITTGSDWLGLKEGYAEKNGTDLRRTLFNKFLFLAEIDRTQAGIRIRSKEKDYYIDMRFVKGELKMHESKLKGSRKGTVVIDIKKLPKALKGEGADNLEFTKDRIIDYFDDYYTKKSNWFQNVRFKHTEEEENGIYYLNFTISNIKKEVLDDFLLGYFERITVNITLKKINNKIVALYEVQAKYGQGILTEPRKGDYTDVDPKYKAYLDEYAVELKEEISTAIKKKVKKKD